MLQLRLIAQQQRQRFGLLDSDLHARRRFGRSIDTHLHMSQLGRVEPHRQPLRAVRRMTHLRPMPAQPARRVMRRAPAPSTDAGGVRRRERLPVASARVGVGSTAQQPARLMSVGLLARAGRRRVLRAAGSTVAGNRRRRWQPCVFAATGVAISGFDTRSGLGRCGMPPATRRRFAASGVPSESSSDGTGATLQRSAQPAADRSAPGIGAARRRGAAGRCRIAGARLRAGHRIMRCGRRGVGRRWRRRERRLGRRRRHRTDRQLRTATMRRIVGLRRCR